MDGKRDRKETHAEERKYTRKIIVTRTVAKAVHARNQDSSGFPTRKMVRLHSELTEKASPPINTS